MSLDAEARVAKLQTKEEVGVRQGAGRDGRGREDPARSTGRELEGIHYLRTFKTSDEIQEDAESADHVVLIGGSYIACEVAASLTAKGKKCTMRDARGGGAVADVRRGGGPVLPRAARVARGRAGRRGGARGVPGGGAGRARCGRSRGARSRATRSSSAPACTPTCVLAEQGRARGGQRGRLRRAAGDLGGGDLRGGRSVLVPERGPRPAAAGGALGRGAAAGAARGRAMLGEERAVPRGALLLQRPGGLGEPRVRRPGREAGTRSIWRGDRDAGEFSAWYIDGGKVAGALSVERSEDLIARPPPDRVGRGRSGAEGRSGRRGQRSGERLGSSLRLTDLAGVCVDRAPSAGFV